MFDSSSIVVQGTVRGLPVAMHALFNPLVGYQIVVAKPDGAGGWTTVLADGVSGFIDLGILADMVNTAGGWRAFVARLIDRAGVILASYLASVNAGPTSGDPVTDAEMVAWLKARLEFFDDGASVGLRVKP